MYLKKYKIEKSIFLKRTLLTYFSIFHFFTTIKRYLYIIKSVEFRVRKRLKKKNGYILSILWAFIHGILLKYIKVKIFITFEYH